MSVINKMLRDLDSRHRAAPLTPHARERVANFARDTLIVQVANQTRKQQTGQHRFFRVMVVFILVAAVAGGWWIWRPQPWSGGLRGSAAQLVSVKREPAPAAMSDSARLAGAPSVMAEQVPNSVPDRRSGSDPLNAGKQPGGVSRTAPALGNGAAMIPSTPARESELKSTPSLASVSLKMDVALKAVPTRSSVAGSTVNPAPPAVLVSSGKQAAALQALAQAQNLWNSGSRDAGIDLLREALALVERSGTAASQASLTPLARELARMELAQGRPRQAFELLARLEPALSSSADVWALRGNAAQRLGAHQESAAAYLTALKLRPEEPRWMLGAAVSLAANGQTDAAAEWAEKARVGGVLGSEVATYLRQLGVPVRER